MLLFWSKDVGCGIAAVRFQSPVLVRSIRIVPSGVAPFTAVPTEVGETRPDDIPLRIYFNAQALPDADKPKGAPNALIPVDIGYHGELCEFPITMEQFSTRLMIFEGAFESLSVAVYGRLASEPSDTSPVPLPAAPLEYKPIELPIVRQQRIHFSMDPAHNAQPFHLAAGYLAELYPHFTLDGIIRHLLVFDAKSNNEHQSNGTLTTATAYPDLASCLAADESDADWLASAVLAAQSPFMAYVPADVDKFSARIQNCLGLGLDDEEPDADQRHYFFELLRHFSCQPDYVILNFLRPGILARFFQTRPIHSASLVRLHEAVANPHVAHSVQDDPAVTGALVAMQSNPTLSRSMQDLARRVLARARGWVLYENILMSAEETPYDTSDALSSTLTETVIWLSDMTSDQSVFGPFLLSVLPNFSPASRPPAPGTISTLRQLNSNTSQVEILRWVRAYQGVASVGATLAWALAEFDHNLIHRLLAILKLWLNSDYKEIAVMVLTQGSILSLIEIFKASDISAILLALITDILSACSSHFKSVRVPRTTEELSNSDSTSYNLAVQYLDGLAADVSIYFDDPAVLHELRSALTLICRVSEMDQDHALRARGPSAYALISSVLRIGTHLVDVVTQTIPLSPSVTYSPVDHNTLLEVSVLLLHTLHHLLATYIQSRRTRQNITHLAIKLFLHSYHPLFNHSHYHNYILGIRESATTLLLTIIESTKDPLAVAETLKDVLEYPFVQPIAAPDVPQRIVDLLDSVLTRSTVPDHGELWSRRLTGVLPELATLLGTIGSRERANVIKRLNTMDDETFGIGAWLLAALCVDMDEAVHSIPGHSKDETKRLLLFHFIDSGFETLCMLTQAEGLPDQAWGSADVARPLASAMMVLIELEAAIVSVVQFAVALSGLQIPLQQVLYIPLALSLLRASRMTPPQLRLLDTIGRTRVLLERDESLEPYIVEKVCEELGFVLARVSTVDEGTYESQNVSSVSAEDIIFLLDWAQLHSPGGSPRFVGLSDASFQRLGELLAPSISDEHAQFLDAARSTIQFADYPPLHLSYIDFASRHPTTFNELKRACDPDWTTAPSTPIHRPKTPTRDNLSVVATLMSPPILRSPTIQLTAPSTQKKYANNDFRQARVSPAGVSRPPSTHVDAFENAGMSPGLATPLSPLSVGELLGTGLSSPRLYHAL